MKRYVILEDDEGSFRELLEMTGQQQRTAPRAEAPAPKEQGLKALVRGLKDEAEMEAIADALEKTNWCRKDAARMLGISYKALLYKMRQFNLDSGRGGSRPQLQRKRRKQPRRREKPPQNRKSPRNRRSRGARWRPARSGRSAARSRKSEPTLGFAWRGRERSRSGNRMAH